ncbi:MAG: hypothetical protein K2O24_09065 [Muribaculaceae bacterium]|nr:hypothetical protein [Muribaculaceae bacterium]
MYDVLNNPECDTDGMATYEYIVNNVGTCLEDMPALAANLKRADLTGQFLASTARFLAAVDSKTFHAWIPLLVEAAIERDRERRYIGSLLEAIWGRDYAERVDELRESDDNFRRIYKRIYPESVM